MNKYLTKTLTVVTLCGVMLTPVMQNVSAQEIEKSITNPDTTYVLNEMMTFEDYSKDFRKDLTKDQMIEAKKLFKEAVKIDDTANEAWDKLFYMDIYDNDYSVAECEEYTFEDFSKDLIKEATETEKAEAKKLFEEAMKLEKDEKYDKAKEVWEKLYNMDIFDYEKIELEDLEIVEYIDNYTFEDFSKELKDDITKKEKEEAKKIFEEAVKLEKDEKYEEAMKTWEKIYNMDIFKFEIVDIEDSGLIEGIDNYILGECKEYTFEDFSKELKDDITKEQKETAKKLFEEAMKLEKNEKYEDAMKIWDELYKKDIFNYEKIDLDIIDCVEYIDEYTFEDFSKELKEDITKKEKEEAKKLFEEAMRLEENEKYEEAMTIWEKLYSLDVFDYTIEDIDFNQTILEN